MNGSRVKKATSDDPRLQYFQDHSRENWLDDIDHHTALLKHQTKLEALRVSLMRRVCEVRNAMSCNRDAQSQSRISSEKLLQSLEAQLARIEEDQARREEEIVQIERRVLTVEPSNDREARTLLCFIADMLSSDHDIDHTYLSDILADCVRYFTPRRPHQIAV